MACFTFISCKGNHALLLTGGSPPQRGRARRVCHARAQSAAASCPPSTAPPPPPPPAARCRRRAVREELQYFASNVFRSEHQTGAFVFSVLGPSVQPGSQSTGQTDTDLPFTTKMVQSKELQTGPSTLPHPGTVSNWRGYNPPPYQYPPPDRRPYRFLTRKRV